MPRMEEFTLPWPWIVAVLAVQAPFGWIAIKVWDPSRPRVALGFIALIVLYVWLPRWGFRASVSSHGLDVYRSTHKVRWDDVTGARLESFLGSRYLLLQRPRGSTVSVPLYLVSHRKIEEALRDWALKATPSKSALRRSDAVASM
jgi:hypothetical protein